MKKRQNLRDRATVKREVPQPTYEHASTKAMSKQGIDESAQRLSRQTPKYSSVRTVKATGQDTFAASYFANPDHIPDKRSPEEKLEEIEIRLNSNGLDDNDRFNLLIQRKSLCVLAYGENSVQTLLALIDLGKFYNEQNRPESGLRNLTKAQQISKSIDIEDDEGLLLSIELSTSYLESKASNKTEQNRQLTEAERIIKPYVEYQSEDKMLLYRRDIVVARMQKQRTNYEEAIKSYQRAMENLNAANGKISPETASLYDEMGETAVCMEQREKANEYFEQGRQTYEELGLTDSAELIAKKIKGSAAAQTIQTTDANQQIVSNDSIVNDSFEV